MQQRPAPGIVESIKGKIVALFALGNYAGSNLTVYHT